MMIVRKSPNMMSMIGRMPAMAAPTPMPLNPASEMGVSMMRSLPNSSTSPVSTLKVVPASATSSPMRTTRGSRRISWAIASLIASPNVSSLTEVAVSSIDVLGHALGVRIRRGNRPFHRGVHLRNEVRLNFIELLACGDLVLHHPFTVERDRIAFGDPLLLFGFGTVIRPRDVADVVAVIAVGDALQEGRALAFSSAIDQFGGSGEHFANVLP